MKCRKYSIEIINGERSALGYGRGFILLKIKY
jgi:hypothetical protein